MSLIGFITRDEHQITIYEIRCVVKDLRYNQYQYQTGGVKAHRLPGGNYDIEDTRRINTVVTRYVSLSNKSGKPFDVRLDQGDIEVNIGDSCIVYGLKFPGKNISPQRILNKETNQYSILTINLESLRAVTQTNPLPAAVIIGVIAKYLMDTYSGLNTDEVLYYVVGVPSWLLVTRFLTNAAQQARINELFSDLNSAILKYERDRIFTDIEVENFSISKSLLSLLVLPFQAIYYSVKWLTSKLRATLRIILKTILFPFKVSKAFVNWSIKAFWSLVSWPFKTQYRTISTLTFIGVFLTLMAKA